MNPNLSTTRPSEDQDMALVERDLRAVDGTSPPDSVEHASNNHGTGAKRGGGEIRGPEPDKDDEGSDGLNRQRAPTLPSPDTCVEIVEPVARSPREQSSAAINIAVLLWRGRSLLAWLTVTGGLLTLGISFLIPNRYESATRLMSPDMRGSGPEAMMTELLGRAGGGLSGMGAGLLGIKTTGAVFVGILQSRTVADTLVKRFNLKTVYHESQDQDASADLADRTAVSEDRKSQIITISVEDQDPRRAANLASAYVEELNRMLVEVNTSSAHRERVFIEERLRVIRPELNRAGQQLSEFSTKNTTLDPKEQGRAMVGAAVTLQGEMIASQTELRGLQQIYGNNNVRIRSLEARIGELRRQLQLMRGRGAPPLASPTDGPDGGEADDAPYPSFRRLPALGITYADLYREVKLREAIFETLTQQYEMAKIAEAKEIPSVKVLDPANLPERKSGPHRSSITLLGGLLSFIFGSTLVVGKAIWQQIDPIDPRKNLAREIWNQFRSAYSKVQAQTARIKTKLRINSKSNSSFEGQDS